MFGLQYRNLVKILLVAAIAPLVVCEFSPSDAQFEIEKLNRKLDDLQGLLQDYANEYTQDLMNLEMRGNKDGPLPQSCNEAMNLQGSGVYHINLPDSDLKPFAVYCMVDAQDTRPWTIIQRRVNGDTDFYRDWQAYKRGFGDLSGNFWIGLDKLHALTSDPNNPHELWIQVKSTVTVDALYSRFVVGDEYERYKLKDLGVFVGTAGDLLAANNGEYFSTYDYDNDEDVYVNCAEYLHGAWWYTDCGVSDLNSAYGVVNWNITDVKYAHMAIRPAQRQ